MCLYSTYTYAYHSLHKHAYHAYYTCIITLCHMLISLVYKLVRYLPVIQVASLNRTTLCSPLSCKYTWLLHYPQLSNKHHSDPTLATPVAEIATSPLLCLWLPLLPLHPLISFTVPLSHPTFFYHSYLHTPFTTHLSFCHMLLYK
jgi:hypothetical protein